MEALPHCLVGQPAGITIVVSIRKRGLQLPWRRHDRRVLQTHPLGISEGQTVAVVRRPVVKDHTCGEAQCISSDARRIGYTLSHMAHSCVSMRRNNRDTSMYTFARELKTKLRRVVTSFHLFKRGSAQPIYARLNACGKGDVALGYGV